MAATQTTYSQRAWDAVASNLTGSELSSHPILATMYAEHRYMGTLMRLLEAELDRLDAGESIDPHVFYESLHYMTHYPDAFHHPREDLVYARAAEVNKSLADSVDTLQRDHDFLAGQGAKALESVTRWRDTGSNQKPMQKAVRSYITEQRKHMEAEEALVFPEIDQVLSDADWRMLEQEDLLAPVPDPVFGPRVAREYRNVARKARRALRRGAEDAALVEWIGLEAFLEGLEVLTIAGESSREAAKEHFNEATAETMELVQDALRGKGLLTWPIKATMAGGSHYIGFLKDLGDIARETGTDLGELRRGVRQRLGLVFNSREPADS